jgi:hypothetical protein
MSVCVCDKYIPLPPKSWSVCPFGVVLLCSGPVRDNDITHWINTLAGYNLFSVVVIAVDPQISIEIDLTRVDFVQ